VGKAEGKSLLGRPKLRREDNVKRYQRNKVEGMDWINLAEVSGKWRAVMSTVLIL
jgi:hypothetical protein